MFLVADHVTHMCTNMVGIECHANLFDVTWKRSIKKKSRHNRAEKQTKKTKKSVRASYIEVNP